jgi:hypothetical protein
MTIQDIIKLMENRLLNLHQTREAAFNSGLIDQVVAIDNEISSTNQTLETLLMSIGA